MHIITKKLSDLIPYQKNPRKIGRKAVDSVAASIEQFGFVVPIVVDENNVIICGHTRLKAAKKLKLKDVPCVQLSDLSPDQVKALRLAENKTSEFAEWDENMLALELLNLDIDMSAFDLGLDEDGEEEKKVAGGKTLREMELRAFEHHDYVIFAFTDMRDFLYVCQQFAVERVNASYCGKRKVGLGRVIDGQKLIERLRGADSDPIKGQMDEFADNLALSGMD